MRDLWKDLQTFYERLECIIKYRRSCKISINAGKPWQLLFTPDIINYLLWMGLYLKDLDH